MTVSCCCSSRPKPRPGKGYLRKAKNLWSYDPNVGKWQRTTERERIAGTDSRRSDFDESRLAEEYNPTFEGAGKLGKFVTVKIKLKAKKGVDVAWPIIRLEVDKATGNVLRRKEYALSGKLMRSSLYPKWKQIFSPSKGKKVWYPSQMRFYDKVQKGNKSVVTIDKVDLRKLPKNIFTKGVVGVAESMRPARVLALALLCGGTAMATSHAWADSGGDDDDEEEKVFDDAAKEDKADPPKKAPTKKLEPKPAKPAEPKTGSDDEEDEEEAVFGEAGPGEGIAPNEAHPGQARHRRPVVYAAQRQRCRHGELWRATAFDAKPAGPLPGRSSGR